MTMIRPLVLATAGFLLVSSLDAQCANVLLPGLSAPGIGGPGAPQVTCSASYDPDGPGPLLPRVALGGRFTAVVDAAARRVASFDPVTGAWSALGTGLDGDPTCLVGLPGGLLGAGGTQALVGGSTLAQWDGSTWSPMASISGPVRALAALPNGDLVVGGNPDFPGLGNARIARWDGVAWQPLGSGIDNGTVHALCVLPNGDLVAGGTFTSAGGVAAGRIARWDGAAWTPLGSGCDSTVLALAALPTGDLIAGGEFLQAGGLVCNRVARWNGAAWSTMQSGANNTVRTLAVLANGHVAAGGLFTGIGGATAPRVARWNGAGWVAVPPGIWATYASVQALAPLPNGDFLVGGFFRELGFAAPANPPAVSLAYATASSLSPIATGTEGAVFDSVQMPNGDLVVGGDLTTIDSVPVTGLARRTGTTWSPLGLGAQSVRALRVMPDGTLVAGGFFTSAGGTPAVGLAQWDGTTWSALGPLSHNNPIFTHVRTLDLLPGGELVVGGQFTSAGGVAVGSIATWDGTTWNDLGGGVSNAISDTVLATCVLPNGDLVIGGLFTAAGGTPVQNIARWDGTAWHALGAGVDGIGAVVYALAVLPTGDLVAAGSFTTAGGAPANGIARWNGSSWSPLGSGITPAPGGGVWELEVLPNGDVLAGGLFTAAGGLPANSLARWNGSSWSPVGTGVDGTVWSLTRLANGDVQVGGSFWTADDAVAVSLSQLTTTCPASATPFGAGCPSSGGSNTLAITSMPYADATMRATGTGLPALAIVLALTSVSAVSPGLPLGSVFAQAPPGCDLLVAPDIQQALLTTTGTATAELFLPNIPPIVGVTFFHQMIPIEIDAQLDFLEITATNALQLTAGTF